ncbi:MAG: DUF3160 domain-containing protein [Candidatus Diapherotrites archaeon]|nr:DUF3160 domain-containing protein [Candidatus Diapherotrites archaeon]
MEIPLQTLEYALPLETSAISNFADFSEKVELENSALQLLQKNGFVVTDYPFYEKQEYITTPYESLKDREIPIFITSDSLLHLYHIQFDETLRIIEEKEFYDAIWRISEKLVEQNQQKYVSSEDELKEAYKKNVAFFSVGMELLKPEQEQLCPADEDCFDPGIAAAYFTEEDLQNYTFEIPALVKEDVDAELALIEEHSGFGESPVFIYREDYSQYVPRGHYTRSEKLKNYFKAMMWYGRISFILKGCDAGCLVSEEEARLQTMAASITASEVNTDPAVKNDWDRIYSVTAFYVGLSDDLGPYEYIEALNYVFGSDFEPSQLNVDTVKELKAKLAEYHSPKIYGGTGACLIDPPFNPEQADECLESTKGFRLMGQRFIPDSYMFSNLVFPYASSYLGSGYAFTTVSSAAGSVRGFPRGLDAMALLGSQRAKELLTELGDDNYEGYGEAYAELEEEFNSFDNAEWNKNLYWAWLFALKPLLKEYDSGYPTFMQTTAWENKQLTTALASWAELRHDTILYAKQSYTPEGLGPGPQEPPVVGYIEPVPEFYNRLLALTSMTNAGLGEMDVLDDASKNRLESLAVILERLRDLSQKELENKELEQADYEFIKNFGDHLNGVIMDVPDKSKKTTIVADVHTDGNSKNVLEEGVGYVKLIAVAYKVPDGRVLIGAGPVMSYYEFKQPMSDRLTDEKWREILDSDEKPSEPEWAGEFYS